MINLNNYYKLKYLKYKNKYISLQTQYAGAGAGPPPPPPPPPKPNPPPAKQGTSGVLSAINFSETDKIPKHKKTVTVDKSNIFYDRDPDYDPDKDPKATWVPNFAKVKPTDTLATSKSPFF